MTVSIPIGPDGGNECCVCCGECYYNCCACPCDQTLDFTIVRCYDESADANGDDDGVCCLGMEFDMPQRPDESWLHLQGGGCAKLADNCYGTMNAGNKDDFPETYGFSGRTCAYGCDMLSPPQHQTTCDGMCITASLSCCRTESYPSCDCNTTVLPYPPTNIGGPVCCLKCFTFEMRGFDCYCGEPTDDDDGDCEGQADCTYIGISDDAASPCSCCAKREPPDSCGTCDWTWVDNDEEGPWWDLDADNCNYPLCDNSFCQEPDDDNHNCDGGWPPDDGDQCTSECDNEYYPHWGNFVGGCADPISGQCWSKNNTPAKKFILLVEGDYETNCDCSTGSFNRGTDSMENTTIHYTGLIIGC